jgi:hypothetical protein
MPSAGTPLAARLGRRRRGCPESEDLPVALHTEPLAEGGFVAKRLVLLLVLSLVLPAAAFAASVHVRVEGKTRTIFAPTEVTVTASNALEALDQASLLGEFYYHITQSSFGPYVDQVGLYGGTADSGWAYKVDNVSPPVGADKVSLKDGDAVLWYYASFGPTGGPPTLLLKTAAGGCYVVQAFDDNGKAATVSGVVVHVGSKRSVPAKLNANVCPGPHPGVLVRATATGAVRSNALR